MYLDYDFYTNTYGGTAISEDEFQRYEARSRLLINQRTFNRVKNAVKNNSEFEIPEDIKLCQCAIMDYLHEYDADGGKDISSETVGKHTVSYGSDSTFDKRVRDIVKEYIGGTSWTYRGGGAGDVN